MGDRLTEEQIEAMREAGYTAHYAGFWVKLDCDLCGNELEVEGDVSNGEPIRCDGCSADLVVDGR